MSNNPFPYKFIAIEGNIGAGKTSLCKMVSEEFNCRLVLEQFADNPFLPYFYADPERHAFSVELFFMTERHKQLQENFAQQDLFQQITIADYFFIKTLLFAKKNLSNEENRLFQRLFNVLNSTFPKPDLLVYLHRSVDNLMLNIEKRGRSYEKDITPEYLQNITDAYFEYFKSEKSIPILVIDVEQMDFISDRSSYEMIIDLLRQKYSPGMQHISFVK